MVIEQRRGLEKRRAEVLNDGIQFDFSSPSESQSYRVRFEDLLREPIEFTRKPVGLPIVRSVILGLGLVFVFMGLAGETTNERLWGIVAGSVCVIGAGIALAVDRVPRPQLLQLSSADPALILFPRTPSATDVDEFVVTLHDRANAYMRETYGVLDSRESKASQVERLFQLKQQGAISQSEYNELKSEVLVQGSIRSGQYL